LTFRIQSSAFADGGRLPEAQVFNGMGYTGANLSPQLAWADSPEGTKSFVVTCYDPDAPTGSGWWHWVVVNLPADCRELPEGAGSGRAALPAGALETLNDFGNAGYGGAAPPPGRTDRNIFAVHALKVDRIDVDTKASGAMVGLQVNMKSLASASTTALFGV